jgi:hypothetical protein
VKPVDPVGKSFGPPRDDGICQGRETSVALSAIAVGMFDEIRGDEAESDGGYASAYADSPESSRGQPG